MLHEPEGTPCPARGVGLWAAALPVPVSEPTGNIDYTTDLQAAFRRAAPKRKRAGAKRGVDKMAVLEDREEGDGQEGRTERTRDAVVPLQHGAMRGSMEPLRQAPARPLVGARRGGAVTRREGSVVVAVEGEREREREVAMSRDQRRRTIYVPSDDTTILTIHPGAYGLVRQSVGIGALEAKRAMASVGGVSVPVEKMRSARQSLAAAPKRIPLQQALRTVQENGSSVDRAGRATGKENVPPGWGRNVLAKKGGLMDVGKAKGALVKGFSIQTMSASDVKAPGRSPMDGNMARPFLKKNVDRISSDLVRQRSVCSTGAGAKSPVQQRSKRIEEKLPEKLAKPSIAVPRATPSCPYPLLEEEIVRPEMFEEAWITNQETTLTELINELFRTASHSHQSDNGPLRQKMMKMYQEPGMVLRYKRLQASLHYGALCLPKESASEASRLFNDLAVRRGFIHLWIKSYSHEVLRPAIEVVVGRQVALSDDLDSSDAKPDNRLDRKSTTRELEDFIETCLFRNADAASQDPLEITKAESFKPWHSNTISSWRRTVQRSLMLISLLDRAKESGIISCQLFRQISALKSSTAALSEFAKLMMPIGCDTVRALAHLDYQLTHQQFPLSEYDYAIQNLAVDLRDGVRLTHLVELLLYPATKVKERAEDATITIPSGEVLAINSDNQSHGVLSQYLKLPCEGRACKIYNVQLALSALQGVQGVRAVVESISPEDIVNGHREKTMVLLWALVSQWGLDTIIDWQDLKQEIRTLRSHAPTETLDDSNHDAEHTSPHLPVPTQLLKEWAQAIARKHGIPVRNLTTSFADGKIFARIVHEYRPFFAPSEAVSEPVSLEAALRQLGCSPSFASMFGRATHFFDRDFTAATLGFLCSRLLGPTLKRRALKRLAHDCMLVVVTRERVTAAARVLQRAWRGYVGRRRVVGDDSVDIWLV